VQRICRYRLLLGAIHSHTPDLHHDKRKLQVAITKIEEITSYINNKCKQAANIESFFALQQKLKDTDIISPSRYLLNHGSFRQNTVKGIVKVDVYILTDLIIVMKDDKLANKLQLKYITILESKGNNNPNVLHFNYENRNFGTNEVFF